MTTTEFMKQETKGSTCARWTPVGTDGYLPLEPGKSARLKEQLGTGKVTFIRYRCCRCGSVVVVPEGIVYDYCPHCGTKMGGVREAG